jgi:hypothetical protein
LYLAAVKSHAEVGLGAAVSSTEQHHYLGRYGSGTFKSWISCLETHKQRNPFTGGKIGDRKFQPTVESQVEFPVKVTSNDVERSEPSEDVNAEFVEELNNEITGSDLSSTVILCPICHPPPLDRIQ